MLRSHTTAGGQRWHWQPLSSPVASLSAACYMQPACRGELFAQLVFQYCMQHSTGTLSKAWGKKVRQDHGTLRVYTSNSAMAVSIRTHVDRLAPQLAHINGIFATADCKQEDFDFGYGQLQAQLLRCLQQAELKNAWMRMLEMHPKIWRGDNRITGLIKDLEAFSFADYQQALAVTATWPVSYFLIGANVQVFDHLLAQDKSKQNASDTHIEESPSQPIQINRQLAEDPEACHSIVFRVKSDRDTQINMEILYAMLQNQFLSTPVVLLHGPIYSYLSFDKSLPITEIPAHMQQVWQQVLAFAGDIPSKKVFHAALHRAKANIDERFQDAEHLCQYLVGQSEFVFDSQVLERLGHFEHVDIAQWMTFVKRLFDFDRQQVFEVVPEVYGQGASTTLRLESLKKRLGVTSEPKQEVLADRYQFQALDIVPGPQLGTAHYAQSVVLGEQHTLIANMIPDQQRTHLTVYFDGGRRFEHEKNAGMTQLLLMSILSGSKQKQAIRRKLQSQGVRIDIENSADFFGFHFSLHPSLLMSVLPDVVALLFTSEFSEDQVNRQKLQLLKAQTIKAKDPFARSVELFYQSLFGIHGYGQPRLGHQTSILHIEYAQVLQALQKQVLQAPSALWVVTSPQQHEGLAVELSQSIPKQDQGIDGHGQLFSIFPKKKLKVMQDLQGQSTHAVCMGLKSIDVKDHRQYYLDVMQIYLSGIGGKLSDALIEKLHLVDTVKAYHVHLLQAGAFFIQLQSKQVQGDSLFEYLQTIFRSLTTVSPGQEGLEIAKQLAVLRRKHRLQQPRELSYDIGSRHFADLGWEDAAEVEQKIKQTQASEIMHVMGDLVDYDSFAMGIC